MRNTLARRQLEIIKRHYNFFIVICYTFQRSIFTLYCLLIYKHISGLHIDDTIVLDGNEINLFIFNTPHIYIISMTQQL